MIDTSIIKAVERAYYVVHNINSVDIEAMCRSTPYKLSKAIHKLCHDIQPTNMKDFLAKRISWWLLIDSSSNIDASELAEVVVRICLGACKVLPHHVVSAS